MPLDDDPTMYTGAVPIAEPVRAAQHVSLQRDTAITWTRQGQQIKARSLFHLPKHRKS